MNKTGTDEGKQNISSSNTSSNDADSQETGRKENQPVDKGKGSGTDVNKKTVMKKTATYRRNNISLGNTTSKNDADRQETGRIKNQPVDKGKESGIHVNKKTTKKRTVTNEDKEKPSSHNTISRKKLKFTLTNAQSITNKRDDLQCYIDEEVPDIIGVVETWLTSETANAELQFPGYQITRLDRQYCGHGGILLYTREGIDVQTRDDPMLDEYEDALWCDISSQGSELDILLGIVYRSDNNTKEMNDCLNNVLRRVGEERKEVMVIGDFNYREIDWETMKAGSKKAEEFLDVVMDNLWSQHVTKPTRQNSLLDLVITSYPNMVDEVDVIDHLGTSDHSMVQWEMIYRVELEQAKPKRDFRNANFDRMKDDINKVNWKEDLDDCSTEEAWKLFKEKFQHQIRKNVPMKHQTKRRKTLWVTKKVQRMIRRKQRAFRKYQNQKTSKNFDHYKKCQKETKQEIRKAKRDFERKLAQNIKEDSKSFYAYVRSKQKIKEAVGPLKTDSGEMIPPGQPTADALNNFFASVFTEEKEDLPIPDNIYKGPDDEKLTDIEITDDCVKKVLKGLDPTKAAGPDEIPPSMLKALAEELCQPLSIIYNKSLDERTVPRDWRTAHIIPIFKKGSRSKAGNYRPISLTSVIGKVLERIIRDQVTEHLDRHSLIFDTQHGFRKGKSCTTNLLEYLEVITKHVDEGTPVDVVYLDLAKAFDTVPHRRLITKIKAHGIDDKVLRWMEAWLADRKQKVVTQGAESGWKDVTSSVVQGSVLGPLCFSMYMNDMECKIGDQSVVSKFADDTKLVHPVKTEDDIDEMQKDIEHLQNWAEDWQMRYNADKCGVMHLGYHNTCHTYHMGNTNLKETKEEKDLGIMIHKSLKVSQQCAAAAKKGNRALGMIKRNFAYRSKDIMVKLYKSLVRPHLDYAMQVWSPHLEKDKKTIEKVQARATKLIPV